MFPLIVEDGSGVTDADSYNSIAELDAYMLRFGHADWPQSASEPEPKPEPDAPEPNPEPEPEPGPEPEPDTPGVETLSDSDETDSGSGDDVVLPEPEPEPNPEPEPVLMRKQAAARKAAIYIDSAYGARFTGTPVSANQGLAWPRNDAVDYYGKELASDQVPLAIKRAHAEVTLLAFLGTELAPQTSGGPLLTRKKIDVLEWEWDIDTYGQAPVFGWVDKLLFNLLGPASEIGALEIMGVQRA